METDRPLEPEIPYIPDHTLLHPIGRGSYGVVWLARTVTGAERAVKVVLRARFEDDAPFEREFDALRCYEPVSRASEGLVHVLHVGRGKGCLYYVMELADSAGTPGEYVSRTLRQDLRKRLRLPLGEVLALGAVLARALQKLHAAGLAHGDVKPSNIIFVGGLPKLADIGLVSAQQRGSRAQGTAAYNPQEGSGSAKADIFTAGLVLYEAATGLSPTDFPAMPEEWTRRPSPQELRLMEVLLRASERDPAARYESAGAMLADLERLQGGEPLPRRNAGAFSRRWLLGAAGLGAVVFAWKQWGGGEGKSLERARRAIAAGDRETALAACREAAAARPGSEAVRDTFITALSLSGGDVLRVVNLRENSFSAPSWVPHSLAFSASSRGLMVNAPPGVACVDVATGAVLRMLPPSGCRQLFFNRDGGELFALRWRAREGEGSMLVTMVQERGDEIIFAPKPGPKNGVPGLERIAAPDNPAGMVGQLQDKRLILLSLDEGFQPLDKSTGFSTPLGSPTGALLAAAGEGHVAVWDLATMRQRAVWSGDASRGMAFTPDSAGLIGDGLRTVARGDAGSGAQTWAVDKAGETFDMVPPVLPGDGRWVAVAYSSSSIAILNAENGRTVARLNAAIPVKIQGMAVSRDGRWLAAAGEPGLLYLWDLHALRRAMAGVLAHWPGEPVPSSAAPLRPLNARIAAQPEER